jgi:general secretion pathway protein I
MKITKKYIKQGFTLLEVALALALGAWIMVETYRNIADGIRLKNDSIKITNATHLAKIKMAQVDSSSTMETNTSKGEIPGFIGYSFETEIKEEELDLLKLSQGGEAEDLKKKAPKDLLGDKDASLNNILKNRGQAQGSQTGGLIKVFHVKIAIKFPLDGKEHTYLVETYRPTKY